MRLPLTAVLSAVLTATVLGSLATPALAHTGGAPATSILAGFLHPLSGIFHVLSMVSIGTMAALVGGRALWTVPAAFIAVMVAGAAVGLQGIALPMVELGIALSVVVLGIATACGRSVPESAAVAMAAVFAVFHGHVHGSEMALSVATALFGAGFVLATALLHALGLFGARLLNRRFDAMGTATVRLAGLGVAATGLGMVGAMI
ncbi:MAG: HupE/UreJ family protein [Alphaproteobacteria bacterium]|nr:HupE/UreJ family protein [Alphaproteobacteria bacterium]